MTQNPIVLRIQRLSDQWYEFTQARDARLLCWELAHDEPSMVDAFFESEGHERLAEHPDLFMPLTRGFQSRTQHGYALVAELAEDPGQDEPDPESPEASASWQAPRARTHEGDIPYLIRACESLHAHHEMPGKLVLVLRPETSVDAAAYQAWLYRLACEAPAFLRVVVLEELEQPVYRKLLEAPSPAIVAVRADLDMVGALQQLSNDAGNLDTPGGRFRDLFLRLTGRIGQGDLGGAMQYADRALSLVAEHALWHLGVPIHFALASGLLTADRPREAALQFTAAEAAATRGEQEGAADLRATCKTLRLQSGLGYGSALLAGKEHPRAAHAFEAAAVLAIELGDQRSALDCHRLASFAWERAGRLDEALREGRAGLEVARAMDAATRRSSTLQHLGEALLRLTTGVQRRGLRRALERDLAALRSADHPGTERAAC